MGLGSNISKQKKVVLRPNYPSKDDFTKVGVPSSMSASSRRPRAIRRLEAARTPGASGRLRAMRRQRETHQNFRSCFKWEFCFEIGEILIHI